MAAKDIFLCISSMKPEMLRRIIVQPSTVSHNASPYQACLIDGKLHNALFLTIGEQLFQLYSLVTSPSCHPAPYHTVRQQVSTSKMIDPLSI